MMSKVKIKIQSKKRPVLKNVSLLYYELINMYNKEYEQVFESKDKNWKKQHDYKNLKEFNYQVNKADVTEKEEEDEDKTGRKLPSWIKVSKSRFNKINDEVTKNYESKLISRIGKKNITLSNEKELLQGIINKRIDRKEAKKVYNNIDDDTNELGKLRLTIVEKKYCLFFYSCKKFIRGLKQKMMEQKMMKQKMMKQKMMKQKMKMMKMMKMMNNQTLQICLI